MWGEREESGCIPQNIFMEFVVKYWFIMNNCERSSLFWVKHGAIKNFVYHTTSSVKAGAMLSVFTAQYLTWYRAQSREINSFVRVKHTQYVV